MSKDIRPIIEGWPHEPGQVTVRKVACDDGQVRIQLRVDLGVLQMDLEGRPDGQRPHGFESLLEYHESQLQQHRLQHGGAEGFSLDEHQAELLRAEGTQYYYRYLSEFVLEEYEAVIRDTRRNLRLLDFLGKHAREETDRYFMEQYRPYIIMMSTRAQALLELRHNRPHGAVKIVREALERLRQYFSQFGQEGMYAQSPEVAALEGLLREMEGKVPVDPIDQLKRRLAQALKDERYEEAARLRDAIAQAQKRQEEQP